MADKDKQAAPDGSAPPVEKADDSAVSLRYRELKDSEKPSPSTVAQEQITD